MRLARYTALLKVCDLACQHAASTGADQTPDFWETVSAALHDDCPQQSSAAARIAASLLAAGEAKTRFFQLLPVDQPPTDHDGEQPPLA